MAVFVDDTRSSCESDVREYLDIYNTLAGPYSGADNPSELNGQKVAYAPEKDGDDTRFVTVEMRFQGALPAVQAGGPPADPGLPDDPPAATAFSSLNIPRFYPWLGSTDIVFSELADAGGPVQPAARAPHLLRGLPRERLPDRVHGPRRRRHHAIPTRARSS